MAEWIIEAETIADIVDGRWTIATKKIVRCKDCKYAHLTYDGDCKYCDKWLDDEGFHLTLYLDGDFYCGYAERREAE